MATSRMNLIDRFRLASCACFGELAELSDFEELTTVGPCFDG